MGFFEVRKNFQIHLKTVRRINLSENFPLFERKLDKILIRIDLEALIPAWIPFRFIHLAIC
jgi:hypothetical protein